MTERFKIPTEARDMARRMPGGQVAELGISLSPLKELKGRREIAELETTLPDDKRLQFSTLAQNIIPFIQSFIEGIEEEGTAVNHLENFGVPDESAPEDIFISARGVYTLLKHIKDNADSVNERLKLGSRIGLERLKDEIEKSIVAFYMLEIARLMKSREKLLASQEDSKETGTKSGEAKNKDEEFDGGFKFRLENIDADIEKNKQFIKDWMEHRDLIFEQLIATNLVNFDNPDSMKEIMVFSSAA